jgi:hypothetical protein
MRAFIFILCFVLPVAVAAQYQARYNYTTVGFQVNALNYFGDLNPKTTQLSTDLSLTRPGFGVDVSFKVYQNIRLRTAFLWSRLRGDDSEAADPDDSLAVFRYARNLHFRNDILELSQSIVIDLIGGRGRFYNRPNVVPYIFGGVAVVYSNPRAKGPDTLNYGGKWVALRPLRTEGQAKEYAAFHIVIPFGGGLRFRIGDRFDLAVEAGLRYTFTDYLDDVSGNYPDLENLDSDLARRMANRTAETVAQGTGKARDMSRLYTLFNGTYTIMTTDGNGYPILNGIGLTGDVRGREKKDLYLTTGFHLNYILNIKRYRPMKRR